MPAERFQTPAELVAACEAALKDPGVTRVAPSGEIPAAAPAPAAAGAGGATIAADLNADAKPWQPSWTAVAILAATVIAVLVVGGWWYLQPDATPSAFPVGAVIPRPPPDPIATPATPAIAIPAWATAHGQDSDGIWADLVIDGHNQRLRHIPAGTFLMGSPEAEAHHRPDELPHQVTISRAFWMADSVVTQDYWKAVTGAQAPVAVPGIDIPVTFVHYDDCSVFLRALNHALATATHDIKHPAARLPTESEWEYACRAGTTGPYYWNDLGTIAWYGLPPDGGPRPVRKKKPNAWGLHDMLGDVYQWTADYYADYPRSAAIDPICTDPDAPLSIPSPDGGARTAARIARGGCWYDLPEDLRTARRSPFPADGHWNKVGFRFLIPDTAP
jgi:formylglycine-generating enzyme required for sulfatase activity